jgi:4'-phosphopantetheinyl transferase
MCDLLLLRKMEDGMIHYDSIWRSPPKDLTLLANEIHVWRAFLDQPMPLVTWFARQLSADERKRAARFHFAHDQRRFTVSRGLLRIVLSGYMRCSPESIQFRYTPYGKPTLAEGTETLLPRFNLSHSHELVLYAFSRNQELGIDVELVRPIAEAKQIAERFFSARENAVLAALAPAEMQKYFFIYWTRKEAYLKARGTGLSVDPQSIDTDLLSEQEADAQGGDENAQRGAQWFLHDLAPAPGYVGALATQEYDTRIVYWQWTP